MRLLDIHVFEDFKQHFVKFCDFLFSLLVVLRSGAHVCDRRHTGLQTSMHIPPVPELLKHDATKA